MNKVTPALQVHNLRRSFVQGDNTLHVLNGVALTLMPGEVVALVGPSGAGKSTLLQSIGLLERWEDGDIAIGGKPCSTVHDGERTAMRRDVLGFVYQFHHLLPEFTALENVMMPCLIRGASPQEAAAKAQHILGLVGLEGRLSHRPAKLSGGEQQRVAIARALVNDPKVLLADEPTGNLDEKTAQLVFDLLLHLVRTHHIAALIATHNVALAGKMDRTLTLHEGLLVP